MRPVDLIAPRLLPGAPAPRPLARAPRKQTGLPAADAPPDWLLIPAAPVHTAPAAGIGAAHRLVLSARPQAGALDKHALDLALSRGRHAVERAYLDGARAVALAAAPGADPGPAPPPAQPEAVYRDLARHGVLTAMRVGACLSAAQIGLPMLLLDAGARAAGRHALALNPGAAPWLVATEPPQREPVPVRLRGAPGQ
jgi:hypothetical protein